MTDLDKPVRRVARGVAGHGFHPDLVITVYPDAVIGIREFRRTQEWRFNAVALLERAVKADVADRLATRRKKRRR